MNYVKELKKVEDKFVKFVEDTCDNRIVGNIEYDEKNECVRLMMLVNYHSQPKFFAEQDYGFALLGKDLLGKKLRELIISFKLNKKFRFDDMKWSFADCEKTYSMKRLEDGFEDFLIDNVKGYKADLEARHEKNLKRIENEIEKK